MCEKRYFSYYPNAFTIHINDVSIIAERQEEIGLRSFTIDFGTANNTLIY